MATVCVSLGAGPRLTAEASGRTLEGPMRVRIRLARNPTKLVATDWLMDAFVEERRRRVRSYTTQPCRLGFTASPSARAARRQRQRAVSAPSFPGAASAGVGSVKGIGT